MKKCTKCQRELKLAEFNKRSSSKDGLAYQCKKCNSDNLKNHYNNNKQKYYEKNIRKKKKIQDLVSKYKSENPCCDCHKKYDPICMDFDHINDDKIKNVSALVNHGSFKKIKEEIDKCELVCANCHRIRTRDRLSDVV